MLVPPGRRLNDAAFVEHIRSVLKPDAALTFMVSQIFEAPLLAACTTPTNYHDGLLPQYRGIAATAWSLYRGAPRSGFAYHHMNEAVDAGPVLLEDTVPVPPGAVTADVAQAKTTLAAKRMPEALGLILEGAAGRAQEGEPSTFTSADLKAIREVGDPSLQTWAELERRLRSFELIHLELAGKRWEVTALRRVARNPRRAQLAFTTADGVRAEPTRFVHLPLSVYRVYRPLRGKTA